jgi:thiamine-phosphate pyrophosphorylase
MLPKLQYISQGETHLEHLRNIESVLTAGVKFVQLRIKNIDDDLYADYAHMAKAICDRYEATFIVNDNVMVAKSCEAHGVHLGLEDMPVTQARTFLEGKIVGGTANTFEQVRQRCAEKVDYIGLGPYRFTATKEKLSPVLGPEGYRELIGKMKHNKLNTPVFAIGGIGLEDVASLTAAGVYGIAVSGVLTRAADKKKLVKDINKILNA